MIALGPLVSYCCIEARTESPKPKQPSIPSAPFCQQHAASGRLTPPPPLFGPTPVTCRLRRAICARAHVHACIYVHKQSGIPRLGPFPVLCTASHSRLVTLQWLLCTPLSWPPSWRRTGLSCVGAPAISVGKRHVALVLRGPLSSEIVRAARGQQNRTWPAPGRPAASGSTQWGGMQLAGFSLNDAAARCSRASRPKAGANSLAAPGCLLAVCPLQAACGGRSKWQGAAGRSAARCSFYLGRSEVGWRPRAAATRTYPRSRGYGSGLVTG